MNSNAIKNFRAGTAIAPFTIVKFGASSSEVVPSSGPGDLHIGVTGELSVIQGERVDVRMGEIGEVRFGAFVGRGQPITSDASGRAVVAAPGARTIGFATVSGAGGDIGNLIVTPTAPGKSPSLDKLLTNLQRAAVANPIDLPNYGSGPTAGLAPPTLTWRTAPAALAAKPQRLAMNAATGNDFAAYYGGIPTPASGSSYGFPVVSSTIGIPTGATRGAVGFAAETIIDDDAPLLELGYSNTGQWRLLVEDQFVAGSTVSGVAIADRAPSIMPNVNSGGAQALEVNFGSRSAKGRKLRIEAELQMFFRAVLIGNDSRAWKPASLDFTRVVFLGDSFVATATEGGNPDSFAHDNVGGLCGKLIGAHDTMQLAVAGTGISSDSALGKRFGSPERMADLQLIANLPGGVDLVVIPMSINDRLVAPATVQADMTALLWQVRAIVGWAVPIVVIGASSGSRGPAALAPIELAGAAAISAMRDPLIGFAPFSTLTPLPGLTGTENISNTTGNGTAGRYIRNDNTHPTFAPTKPGGTGTGGMEYHARIWAAGIRNALTAMR